jgi:hypothetical protein
MEFDFVQGPRGHFSVSGNPKRHLSFVLIFGEYSPMFSLNDIQLAEEYVGLYWTTFDAATGLADLASRQQADCWLYRSVQKTVAILSARRHAEPIMEFLREAHERFPRSSSVIGGLMYGSSRDPPPADAYIVRFRLGELNAAMISSIVTFEGGTFCVFLPGSQEFFAAVTTNVAVKLLSAFPSERLESGLEFVSRVIAPITPSKPKRRYDPIQAQVSEVLNRSSIATKESLRRLRQRWASIVQESAPEGISFAETFIEELTDRAQDLIRSGNDRLAILQVDAAAHQIRVINQECERLGSLLVDYAEAPDVWSQTVPYSDRGRQIFLKTARNFSSELADRAGAADRISIVPAYEDQFTYYEPFGWLFRTNIKRTQNRKTVVIGCPRMLQLRLGAIPIIAHSIAHEFADGNAKLDTVRNEIADFLLPGVNDLLAPTGRLTGVADNRDQISRMAGDTARRWATEVVCDLVGVMLAGPAFVWSFLRFLTGTLSEFAGNDLAKTSRTHPPLPLRASGMLETVKWMGLPSDFYSQFSITSAVTIPPKIIATLYAAIPRPYSLADHQHATGVVKSALMEGRCLGSPKTIILNALWDGVIHSDGYVNEVAVALSMLA